MKKTKRFVAAILGCVMLIGGGSTAFANDYTYCNGLGGACQKKMNIVIATGSPCSYSGCKSAVYLYRCPDYTVGGFHAQRGACSSGHLN